MRVSCYLIVEPVYDYAGNRPVSAKITGIRQRKPGTLDNEAQAVLLYLDVPPALFEPAVAVTSVNELPPKEMDSEAQA